MGDFIGYTMVEPIDETLHSLVYRARKEGESATVIIKALRTEYPTPAEVARFKHECELIRGLEVEGVVRVLDVIDHEGQVALVLEDFGGVTLKEIIKGGFTIERFLELAIRISEILGEIHRRNISHRDIKPLNILMNWEEDIVKITDFGISAEFTRQNVEVSNPTVMEGTLAYISPEQTGRMNCAVDYRTDLYSLGVTFYEMLTGDVPFMAQDAMELIHAHIAKVPVPPEKLNPDIPGILSDIVMKLMSKAPAQRYQNCFGLAADLKECLERLKTAGRITPFPLGRHDMALRFILPQILVGRDEELSLLHAAFERVSRGGVEILLVKGEPGIGKSALIHEIHKPIVEKRGFFISGKYDQFRRSVPYSAIIQAFQGLARQLLTESDERLLDWRDKILSALGPNGKIITDAIPEVEHIIGKQPDIPELGPEETQNRFNLIFKNFVRVFADRTHPLVMFLDDLQWADSASLSLILTITTDKDLRHCLCMGAYRDNEVAAHHPLMLTADAMRAGGVTVNTATLGALKPEDVEEFIAYFLHCDPEIAHPLALIIYHKTKGNPFFVNQFLKTLYDEGTIAQAAGGVWTWDLPKIQDLQVTDNVVEFMARKLHDLPAEPLKLIPVCACIGNRFDVLTLATITGQAIEALLFTLDTLIQEGLINLSGDLYRFHHDRIQEAAVSLLSPQERELVHYLIGTLDLGRTADDQIFNRIFYIVDQLNQGRGFITDPAERTRLADLNLKAGIKAKDSTAYAAAVNYLGTGLELLDSAAWTADYGLAYALYLEQMECQYLNRDFAEAARLFEIIIDKAASRIDKAKAYKTMLVLYTTSRPPKEAIELGLKGLKMFGINIPIDVGKGPVAWEIIKARRLLKKIPLEKILDLPPIEDKETLAAHEIMLSTGVPAYYANPNLFALFALKGVNDNLEHGRLMPHSAVAFMALACIIQTATGDYELSYRIGEMALKLNERLGNLKLTGQVHHVFAFFIQHWKKHIRHDYEIFAKVYELSLNAGDFIFAGHSINAGAEVRLMCCHTLDDILDDLKKYHEFMQTLKDPLIVGQYHLVNLWIKTIKGLMPERANVSGDGFDLNLVIDFLRQQGNHFGLCFSLYPKIFLHALYGEYEEALKLAEELDQIIHVPIGTLLTVNHYFHYSLIMTGLLRQGEVKRARKFNAILRRNQRKMRTWAALCPENFKHKYDLVEAETAGLAGRLDEALRLYHAAIEGARRNEFILDEAIACERLAQHYISIGSRDEAGLFIRRAYQCYRSWGAEAKVKDLEARYPELIRSEIRAAKTATLIQTTATESSSRFLDLSTVMQVSQVISSEIMLERLLQKTMHMSMANAGAERGYLILESDGRLTVEASEDVHLGESRVLQSIPLEDCDGLSLAIVNYVSRSGTPLILADAMSEGAFMNDPHIVRGHCKSILCTPITSKGKLTGILYMENNLTAGAFTPERLEILRLIAAQAAISLENAKLFDLATTDGLTKLFVHRYFQLMLDAEIQRSRRYNRPFSLAMIDIDDFKHFNDTYGHQLGDEVLRSVGRAIRKNTRNVDVSARYGGEEFVIVFPETDLDAALIAAEKVRRCVEQIEIPHEGAMLQVTISLGLAVFPRHAQDKDDLIKSADEALYVSKREGKNRVSVGEKIEP